MSDLTPLPSFSAVIVAAGKGVRAGQKVPKQFAPWRGKPVLRHSVEAMLSSGAETVVIAAPSGMIEEARSAAGPSERISVLEGAETRQGSVLKALEALSQQDPERVLIHDAARPGLRQKVVERLLAALEAKSGAIPVLPVVDSLAVDSDGLMAGSADRDSLRRVQTPQAFRFADILAAHHAWEGEPNAGDDAQVLAAAGHDIALVEGDEALHKLTFAEDFMQDLPPIRVGTGFDVHRLGEGEELWLCGVKIDHPRGLIGHSDADVALHAITDAILGAAAAGDIGQHFSPKDERWRGADSAQFIRHAAQLAQEAGYTVSSVDLTIICEEPKIGPHRETMREKIATLLDLQAQAVSVKATTTEKLGFTGRGEGIAAQAVATLVKM